MTQERLAELTGIHRVTIARYESGDVSPTARNLLKLSDVLRVPVDKLIDRAAVEHD